MSEYGWSRRYILWMLPFSSGIKFIASITRRLSGRDIISERIHENYMRRLAEAQTEFNLKN